MDCTFCHGTGKSTMDCTFCHGTGKVDCMSCHGTGKSTIYGTGKSTIYGTGKSTMDCVVCHGTGKSTMDCTLCHGTGKADCMSCHGTGKSTIYGTARALRHGQEHGLRHGQEHDGLRGLPRHRQGRLHGMPRQGQDISLDTRLRGCCDVDPGQRCRYGLPNDRLTVGYRASSGTAHHGLTAWRVSSLT